MHVNMCADMHTHGVVVPDHHLGITGKEVFYKGHPGTIRETEGKSTLSVPSIQYLNQQFTK